MEQVTKSIRILREYEIFLLSNFKNFNQGVNACILKAIEDKDRALLTTTREYSLYEVKGRFTLKEWNLMMDALNGIMTLGRQRFNAGVLASLCRDAGKEGKWGVDIDLLASKIESLTSAQVEAVYFFIEGLWNGREDIDGALQKML